MASQNVALTYEQAYAFQDELIQAYNTPEFQQKLHKLIKAAAGDPMEETKARSELCLPLQIPVLVKYGFSPDRKGVSASLKAFRAPELQKEDLAEQAGKLAYLVNPSLQDMDWVEKMGITESPLIKEEPKKEQNVALTYEQAYAFQDELIQAYNTPEFQQKLHKLIKAAAGDPMEETKARSDICLPIQIPVLVKYGFSPDRKGVSASLKAFRAPELQKAELAEQAGKLAYLVTPSMQDMDWVEKMGITESPLIKDEPKKEQKREVPDTPSMTLEQGREMQESLIAAYSQPEFQQELHRRFKALGDDTAKQATARSELCLPVQQAILPKYGFDPSTPAGVAESMKPFRTPEFKNDAEIIEQGGKLFFLVNPSAQTKDWILSMGITESPVSFEPIEIFSLVEIVGLTAAVEPSAVVLEIKPDMQAVRVNGHKGWVVAWAHEEKGFIVQTLGGDYVCLPEDNLRVYKPTLPELGGFDTAWPPNDPGLVLNFSTEVAGMLQSKSFCVVQMMSSEERQNAVLEESGNLAEWTTIAPEFQAKLMGRNSSGVIRWLSGYENQDPDSWIGDADASLGMLADVLDPFCPELGFRMGGRSKTLLRLTDPTDSADSKQLVVSGPPVMNGDEVGSTLKFLNQSKICMIYFLYGNGGFLTIDYIDGEQPQVSIPIQAGQLVLFNQDQVRFSHDPTTKSIVLQTWITREELPGEITVKPDFGVVGYDASKFPRGPAYGDSGETVDVMSMQPILGGNIDSAGAYWALLIHCGDCPIEVPIQRWDKEVYYEPTGANGKMYTKHFGMIERYDQFDNEMFGLTQHECDHMDIANRKSIESVYSCLTQAGYDMKSLQGRDIAVSGANSGTDWQVVYHKQLTVQNPGSYGLSSVRVDTASCRIPYILGLRGAVFQTDTACSASLSATAILHSKMRPTEPDTMSAGCARQILAGVVFGCNGIFDPDFPTALCGAGMLSHAGRCFTFDASADGFARGDGTTSMYYEVHNKETLTRYAMLAGSCLNQDGRSASLTAPNGPSQQECIRHSLREANITPADIHMQELHGTGTSLGDPIEVGALRATMMKINGKVRAHPLVKTSSKSNFSHLEANAGITGIMKCVLMGAYGVAPGGLHLRMLNGHIEYNGYPVLFNPEAVDQNTDSGYCGVSSFGFSGCNARGDVFAACTMGPRSQLPLGNTFTYERHLAMGTKPEHMAKAFQLERKYEDGLGLTDEWAGFFQTGNPIGPGTTFQVSGSWSNFDDMEPMVPYNGGFAWGFIMGDTLVEDFRIHTDYFFDSIICPATKKADRDSIILGPGTAPKGYHWRVDGRSDGAEPGDLYMVFFAWDEKEKQKKVEWYIKRGEDRAEMESLLSIPVYEHRYSVKASWSAWTCIELEPVLGLGYIHETTFRIGLDGYEEFYIVRDASDEQQIYPAATTSKDTKVAVRGPDGNRKGRCWRVQGETGDKILLRFRVRKGDISVSVISSSSKERTWNRPAFGMDGTYFVEGSWLPETNGSPGLLAMTPVSSKPNVFTAQMTMSALGSETFRILVDEETDQAFYPEMVDAGSGQAVALGPDHLGCPDGRRPGLYWRIEGQPGASMQITLDLTTADKRQRVTWTYF